MNNISIFDLFEDDAKDTTVKEEVIKADKNDKEEEITDNETVNTADITEETKTEEVKAEETTSTEKVKSDKKESVDKKTKTKKTSKKITDPNKEVIEKCKKYNKLILKVYADCIEEFTDKEFIENINLDQIREEYVAPSNPEFGSNTKWHIAEVPNNKECAYIIPISPFYAKG